VQTATDIPLSPRDGDISMTGDPSDRAPPGLVFALFFRRTRDEAWQEVYRHESAEALWLWSLQMPSGYYREVMVRTDLFDAERGGR